MQFVLFITLYLNVQGGQGINFCVLLSFKLLSHVFDNHVMDLLFYYIDLRHNKDIRLAFEALKVNKLKLIFFLC